MVHKMEPARQTAFRTIVQNGKRTQRDNGWQGRNGCLWTEETRQLNRYNDNDTGMSKTETRHRDTRQKVANDDTGSRIRKNENEWMMIARTRLG